MREKLGALGYRMPCIILFIYAETRYGDLFEVNLRTKAPSGPLLAPVGLHIYKFVSNAPYCYNDTSCEGLVVAVKEEGQ